MVFNNDDAFSFFLCIELWVKLNSGTPEEDIIEWLETRS